MMKILQILINFNYDKLEHFISGITQKIVDIFLSGEKCDAILMQIIIRNHILKHLNNLIWTLRRK